MVNINYAEKRKDILEICDQLLAGADLNPGEKNKINDIRVMTEDNAFKVAVVGEFSAGKSTFINSIIGKDILTHASTETTAAVTYVVNVAASDERCGSFCVTYRDGRKEIVDDLLRLKDYTTRQSSLDVEKTIEKVEVYIHFINTQVPIVFVDTPGLNTTIEEHHIITFKEIKRSHCCVYILGFRGVSETDRQRIVKFDQNRLVFIQNQIDNLNASEGETAESKVAKAKQVLKAIIDEEAAKRNMQEYDLSFDVIGYSALKALAGRDTGIKKLYPQDEEYISDGSRPELLDASGYKEFVDYFENLMNSGEYLSIVVNTALNKMIAVLSDIKSRVEEEREAYRNSDNVKTTEKINEHNKEMLGNIEDDREERLNNFITARKVERTRECIKKAEEYITKIYDDMCKDIEDRLSEHDKYERFEKTYHKQIPEYYDVKINKLLDVAVKAIKSDIEDILKAIYSAAEAEAESYAHINETLSREDRFTVSLTEFGEKFEMDSKVLGDHNRYMKERNNRLEKAESDLEKCEKVIRKNEGDIPEFDDKLKKEQEKKNDEERDYHLKKNNLGSMPAVEIKYEPYTYYTETRFLFWSWDTEHTGYDRVEDDSKQRAWRAKLKSLEDSHRNKQNSISSTIRELEKGKQELKDDTLEKKEKIRKLFKEIDSLKTDIANEEESYKITVSANKKKYMARLRENYKSKFRDCLLSETGDELSMLQRLGNYIESSFNKHEKAMQEAICESYRLYKEKRKKEINDEIAEGEKNIREILDKYDKAYERLNDCINRLIGGLTHD